MRYGKTFCTIYPSRRINYSTMYVFLYIHNKNAISLQPTHTLSKTRGERPTCDSDDEERGEERGSSEMESPGPGK
jgi:hypothetical protein